MNKAYTKIDKDQREKVIEEFLPVIKHLAYKMSRGFEGDNLTDDLISAGIIGVLEVMEKYDASRGAKLNTFAYLRIRGAMIDELRSRDWFPRSARAKAKKIQEAARKLEHEMGRYPDEEEVAAEARTWSSAPIFPCSEAAATSLWSASRM